MVGGVLVRVRQTELRNIPDIEEFENNSSDLRELNQNVQDLNIIDIA